MTRALTEMRLVAGRNLRHIPRVPEKLADATIQPVIFILLFVYVFGSAIQIPGGGDYREYLISGMFATAAIATVGGLAVGIADDIRSGLVDRLRALPIARVSFLGGRALSELAERSLGTLVMIPLGLAIGWAPHGTWLETLAVFPLMLGWSFATAWLGVWCGLIVRDPEAAQTITFTALLPLMFISTVFVPADGLPAPLRQIAEYNPISTVAAAIRQLFHNPAPPAPDVWPLQHPVVGTLLWTLALTAVFAPLAVRRYRLLDNR
jgi:ABC-2 type transport system permease protein